jgi:sugar transferase (PEP-CTERM/EpsH1 system associated)
MRVLFLSQVLPYPLDGGPKLRAYYVLRHLAARHDVTLVAFAGRSEELTHVEHLASFCKEVYPVVRNRSRVRDGLALVQSMLDDHPLMIRRHHEQGMAHLIEGLLDSGHYDVIHVDQLKMGQYVSHVRTLPKLIDKHNAYADVVRGVAETERNLPRRWVARLEWPRLARYEGWLCRQFDHVLTVTEEDGQRLQEWAGQPLDLTVMPIAGNPDDRPPVRRTPGARDILSVGAMFYPPNVDGTLWFTREVYPLIREELPDARLWLVGGRPAPAVRRLARHPGIEVTGYVEDLLPYLERSAVWIAPLRFGSGMRVKILDAMTWGIPVVSTTLGCQGIAATPGEEMLVADDPPAFAGHVVRVIEDRALAGRLAAGGRRLIERVYDWQIAYRVLDEVYERLLER